MAAPHEAAKEKIRRKSSSSKKPSDIENIPEISRTDVLVFRVSRPGGDQIIAEFKMSATDAFSLFLDKVLVSPSEFLEKVPNEKLAASLLEAKKISPRFNTAKELFDGLEKAVRG